MSCRFYLQTDYPVAFESADHLEPEGVMNDNTTCIGFIEDVERDYAGRPLRMLDLGCAGGALVHDFLKRGHMALGLEGSDFNLVTGRAEWEKLGGFHLLTCDISRPFSLYVEEDASLSPYLSDLITSWEVMEHLSCPSLPTFFDNIRRHLKPGGKYVAGVSTALGKHHQSVFPKEVWEEEILNQIPGLALKAYPYLHKNHHDPLNSYYFMLERT